MTTIGKGKITSIADGRAVVQPYEMGAALTPPLPAQIVTVKVPPITYSGENLNHTHQAFDISVSHPVLKINKDVLFALFGDGTGVILGDA